MGTHAIGSDRSDAAAADSALDDQASTEALSSLRCAYFYYVTPGENAESDEHTHAEVKAFLMQEGEIGPSDKIEDLIPIWAQRARDAELTPVGWALGDLRWRRKSYLVVVLDAGQLRASSKDALVITDGCHTFKNKKLIEFTTVDGTAMQAIYCRNHMQKRNGGRWGQNESERFKPLRLDLTSTGAFVRSIVTHDDVGTNTGPPRAN